jgi:hypothetical protein
MTATDVGIYVYLWLTYMRAGLDPAEYMRPLSDCREVRAAFEGDILWSTGALARFP